ncbi:MAG: hypothetical protein IT380_29930 [Myxococcales bacterium]|nr:hypothetical protein [Myxococcales bacterium]
MRWWTLLGAALALLASSCGANAPYGPNCAKRLQTPAPPLVVVALAGKPLTVSVEFPLVIACAGGNPVATSVETRVLDARLQPVPHQASAPSSSDTEGYLVQVDFTPQSPGLYSLSARFEPGLGVARREVLVVADRTASTPVARFRPSGLCDAVEEVGDTVLCARAASAQVEAFARDDGAPRGALPAEVASFAPGVAWTLSGGRVTRWVAGDGGLLASAVDGVDAGFVGLTHAATSDALRLVSGREYVEVRWDGAALESGVTTLSVSSTGRAGLLVLEDGQALAFEAWPQGPPAPGEDAGVDAGRDAGEERADAGPTRVCHLPLVPRPDAGVVCTPARLRLGAREGDALWLRAEDSQRVGLLRYLPGTQTPAVVFLAAQPVALVDVGRPLPFFTWSTFTVVLRPDDLLLEAFPPPPGRVRTGASPTHVWFLAADGGVEVHRR